MYFFLIFLNITKMYMPYSWFLLGLSQENKLMCKEGFIMSATKYVGKMSTAERVCSMLNISSEGLQDLVQNNMVLRLTNNHGQEGYPVFQFDNESINPDVQQVIKILLDGGYDPMTVAFWVYRPSELMDGMSTIEYMAESQDNKDFIIGLAELDVANLKANF